MPPGLGGEGNGQRALSGCGCPFGKTKTFWGWCWTRSDAKAPRAAKLNFSHLKMVKMVQVLGCIYFTTIINNNKNKTTHTSGARTQNGGELEAWRPVEPCTSRGGTVVPETEGGSRTGVCVRVGSCDMMRGSLSRTGEGRIQGDAGGSG